MTRPGWAAGGLFLLLAATASDGLAQASPDLLEGGQTILESSISEDGSRVLTRVDDPSRCWAVNLLSITRDSVETIASATSSLPAGAACGPVTIALSGDGRTVAIHHYTQDRLEILREAGGRIEALVELAIEGLKGFENPPPAGLALDRFGTVVAAGAPNFDCRMGIPVERCGTVLVFGENAGRWSQIGQLVFPEPRIYAVNFGTSLAMSADGRVMIAGGVGHAGDPGVLFAYERIGGQWFLDDVLNPEGRDEGAFGQTVRMSANGRRIAVAGNQKVHLFIDRGEELERTGVIEAPADAGGFGIGLALSADGSRLGVGAPRAGCPVASEIRCGAAYLFEWGSRDRTLHQTIRPASPVPMSDFGHVMTTDAAGERYLVQGTRPFLYRW